MAHSIQKLITIFEIKNSELYWKNHSQKWRIGKKAGYINNNGYLMIEYDGSVYLSHRLIWAIVNGKFPKKQIDHINGKKIDNRIENLRDVDNRTNCGNRIKNINGKLVGAYYHKKDKKWHSQIKINGKSTYISSHKTELEAHKKYLETVKNLGVK